MKANARTVCCAIIAWSIFPAYPAAAFYSQVKPGLTMGTDCIGQISSLAPKLRVCAIAGARTRIWCPDGKMFEGESEERGAPAALARSLCNMVQVP